MKTTPRKPTRLEREYLAHVRRAQARKIPLAQYCRARGLNVQSLYNVRYRMAGKDERQTEAKPRKSLSKFVAVQLAPAQATVSAVTACRLHSKGWVIECASLPPTAWVAGLLAGERDAVS